ncbi:hypothetical protein [Yoonia maricola]|nr:hypothetical protein [Yoonia maricola]
MSRFFPAKTATERHLHMEKQLAAFDLKIAGQSNGPISMFNDFGEEAQLTVVPVSAQTTLWLGWPVTYILEDLFPSRYKQSSQMDALFIAQDSRHHRYEHQYLCNGKLGEGCITSDYAQRFWVRTYRQADWPPPVSHHLSTAMSQFVTEARVNAELAKRVYTGMYGKGRYGMAYHPAKDTWVMARSLPDQKDDPPSAPTKEFQELNPNSYAKKGKPFAGTKDPKTGHVFFRQADIIRELQHRAIAASIGFRLDEAIVDQAVFQGSFDKYWIER